MLDRTTEEESLHTREEEELDQELAQSLKYRDARVQEDLVYNRRSAKKREEEAQNGEGAYDSCTRRYSRWRGESRTGKKGRRERRARLRARDDANDRFGRYGDVNRDEDRRR
jgi:hypothetical protein